MAEDLEAILVAHWSQQTEQDFLDLSGDDQARLVAAYRTDNRLRALLEVESARKSRSHQRRSKAGKGQEQDGSS